MSTSATLDQLTALTKALVNNHPSTEDFFDGDRAELADRIDVVKQALADLRMVDGMLQTALALLMETNDELIPGFGYAKRERVRNVQWDKAGIADAVRRELMDLHGLDPTTGEKRPDWRLAIERALADFAKTRSDDPRVRGLQALGLDVDEYRSTDLGGWKVTVTRLSVGGVN